MAHSYLSLVNGVRIKLRYEPITAFPSNDPLHQTITDLVDEAAREILEERIWPFDVRHDEMLHFYGPIEGSGTGTTLTDEDFDFRFENVVEGANARDAMLNWTNLALSTPSASRLHHVVPRLLIDDSDSPWPETSNIVRELDFDGSLRLQVEFAQPWQGSAKATLDWKLFFFEAVLPATVRQVLAVYNDEEPMELRFGAHPLDLGWTRPHDDFRDPHTVYLGGTATSVLSDDPTVETGVGAFSAVFGDRLAVWPIPDKETLLPMVSVYRHPALSAETDLFTGVPDHVADLIEWKAFEKALMGNIQNDPARAALVRQENERRIDRVWKASDPDPYRRRVPRPFGSLRVPRRRNRFDSQEIPNP